MEGKILQILGPVVDVEFEGQIPAINDALTVTTNINGEEKTIVLEVAAQIGDNVVRTIAMDSTEGLKIGDKVTDTGSPITVPVGPETLGRIINVIGEPIDQKGKVSTKERWPIHRPAPKFTDQSTETEILVTGIKVVDLLAPYAKGGNTLLIQFHLRFSLFYLFDRWRKVHLCKFQCDLFPLIPRMLSLNPKVPFLFLLQSIFRSIFCLLIGFEL